MDPVVKIAVRFVAIFCLFAVAAIVFTGPIRAAAATEPFDGGEYICRLLVCAAVVILAGGTLGWW